MTKTGQNRSSAVMQQRSEPHDSLDDFPTPPWGGRALVVHVLKRVRRAGLLDSIAEFVGATSLGRLWEPACNRGFLLHGLSDYFDAAYGSDIFDYVGNDTVDFLFPSSEQKAVAALGGKPEWIISNPPFRLAEEFIERCRQLAPAGGYAMLVRTSFLEGVGRHKNLFTDNPPTVIAQYAERLPMVKGRCNPKAKSATSYCWLVWINGALRRDPLFVWIPPCRKALERAGDYA